MAEQYYMINGRKTAYSSLPASVQRAINNTQIDQQAVQQQTRPEIKWYNQDYKVPDTEGKTVSIPGRYLERAGYKKPIEYQEGKIRNRKAQYDSGSVVNVNGRPENFMDLSGGQREKIQKAQEFKPGENIYNHDFTKNPDGTPRTPREILRAREAALNTGYHLAPFQFVTENSSDRAPLLPKWAKAKQSYSNQKKITAFKQQYANVPRQPTGIVGTTFDQRMINNPHQDAPYGITTTVNGVSKTRWFKSQEELDKFSNRYGQHPNAQYGVITNPDTPQGKQRWFKTKAEAEKFQKNYGVNQLGYSNGVPIQGAPAPTYETVNAPIGNLDYLYGEKPKTSTGERFEYFSNLLSQAQEATVKRPSEESKIAQAGLELGKDVISGFAYAENLLNDLQGHITQKQGSFTDFKYSNESKNRAAEIKISDTFSGTIIQGVSEGKSPEMIYSDLQSYQKKYGEGSWVGAFGAAALPLPVGKLPKLNLLSKAESIGKVGIKVPTIVRVAEAPTKITFRKTTIRQAITTTGEILQVPKMKNFVNKIPNDLAYWREKRTVKKTIKITQEPNTILTGIERTGKGKYTISYGTEENRITNVDEAIKSSQRISRKGKLELSKTPKEVKIPESSQTGIISTYVVKMGERYRRTPQGWVRVKQVYVGKSVSLKQMKTLTSSLEVNKTTRQSIKHEARKAITLKNVREEAAKNIQLYKQNIRNAPKTLVTNVQRNIKREKQKIIRTGRNIKRNTLKLVTKKTYTNMIPTKAMIVKRIRKSIQVKRKPQYRNMTTVFAINNPIPFAKGLKNAGGIVFESLDPETLRLQAKRLGLQKEGKYSLFGRLNAKGKEDIARGLESGELVHGGTVTSVPFPILKKFVKGNKESIQNVRTEPSFGELIIKGAKETKYRIEKGVTTVDVITGASPIKYYAKKIFARKRESTIYDYIGANAKRTDFIGTVKGGIGHANSELTQAMEKRTGKVFKKTETIRIGASAINDIHPTPPLQSGHTIESLKKALSKAGLNESELDIGAAKGTDKARALKWKSFDTTHWSTESEKPMTGKANGLINEMKQKPMSQKEMIAKAINDAELEITGEMTGHEKLAHYKNIASQRGKILAKQFPSVTAKILTKKTNTDYLQSESNYQPSENLKNNTQIGSISGIEETTIQYPPGIKNKIIINVIPKTQTRLAQRQQNRLESRLQTSQLQKSVLNTNQLTKQKLREKEDFVLRTKLIPLQTPVTKQTPLLSPRLIETQIQQPKIKEIQITKTVQTEVLRTKEPTITNRTKLVFPPLGFTPNVTRGKRKKKSKAQYNADFLGASSESSVFGITKREDVTYGLRRTERLSALDLRKRVNTPSMNNPETYKIKRKSKPENPDIYREKKFSFPGAKKNLFSNTKVKNNIW